MLVCNAAPRTCCSKVLRSGGVLSIDHSPCVNSIDQALLMSSVLLAILVYE